MSTGRAIHQEELLKAILPGACLTIEELESATSLSRRQITNAATRLIQRGYVERVEIGCFQLTKAGDDARANGIELTSGPNGPLTAPARRARKTTFRQRLWRVIGVSDKFAVRDLVAAAANGNEKDPIGNAAVYLSVLEKAGYIRRLPVREKGTALTSNGFIRYARIKHTGPVSPQCSRDRKSIYDPNTKETVSWK